MKIKRFMGGYRFLSNFFVASIEVDGVTWPSTEHFYQAMKSESVEVQEEVRMLPTPGKAKRMGKTIKLRSNWDEIKDEVMETAVHAKFTQNEELRAMLLETGDSELIEGNTWGDRYWGVDLESNVGKNMLGKTLMKVRETLREAI
jgi:ribA/ribD-fused uncharacterized protein